MISTARKSNRRTEPRHRLLTGQRMSWHTSNDLDRQRQAWVLDVSQSGLGLMIEDGEAPQVGDEIRVKLRAEAPDVAYEVVRLQNERSRIVVIGCERVYGRSSRLNLPLWSSPPAERRLARAA